MIRIESDKGANVNLPWCGRMLELLSNESSCFTDLLFSEMFKNTMLKNVEVGIPQLGKKWEELRI